MPKKNNAQRADGRFAISVYVGTIDGKKKYKSVYGRTQKEANAKADEIRRQLGRGIDLLSDETFEFWAQKWLAARSVETSSTQYNASKSHVSYFLRYIPTCGEFSNDESTPGTLAGYAMRDIKLYQLQDVIDSLYKFNPKTHKKTAKKTLNEIRKACINIFDNAYYNKAIDINIAAQLKVPQNAAKKERRALTEEEQTRVVNFNHRAQMPAMIMMYTGLRIGEITALTWSDIDFKQQSITINKSYDFKNKRVKEPKTAAGARIVPVPDKLMEYIARQPKRGIFVISSACGNRMTDTAWRRLLESYLTDLNLKYGNFSKQQQKFSPRKVPMMIEPFTWHCLRHTYATILYDAGVDVLTAKKLLGHSDVKTTLGIYTHLSAQKEQSDISKLNAHLNGNVGQMSVANADKC